MFKFSFSILKFLKIVFHRFGRFGLLFIEEYRYDEKTFHRKDICLHRVANLGDFSPKKSKFGDSFDKCSGHFKTNIRTFKMVVIF
jgi:hypothetical protein